MPSSFAEVMLGGIRGLASEAAQSVLDTKNSMSFDPEVAMSHTVDELRARGIYDRISFNNGWDQRFSRIGIIDPYHTSFNTKEYVFFVKPDLHLFNGSEGNPELVNCNSFFADAIYRYRHVAEQLCYSISSNRAGGPLSPLLSNAFSGNLELPEISADTIETPQNAYGTKMEYRGSSFKSDEGFDFSCDFKDTKYLEIYMWLKMYDEYEKMKWRGQVTPTKDDYIVYKNLHDQMAIYKFIVADDGMTLLYWARIMGAFPKSVPRDAFGKLDDGEITYSTSWHGQFVTDMDPAILADFNNITAYYRGSNFSYLPLYDIQNHRFNPTWAKCPVIVTRRDAKTNLDKMNMYYFMWVA